MRGVDCMKVKLVEGTSIEEGKHKGEIVDLAYRSEPFNYVDVIVTVDDMKREDGTPFTLKYGMPYKENATSQSKLGEFLDNFGFKMSDEVELDSLKGRKVTYITKVDNKGYSEIVSIKPQ